jgi:dTDP-4-dehydrorhamnose reductase
MKRVPLGIYNVTNPGSVTAREVIELIKNAGVSKKEFSFFETEEEFMSKATIAPRSNCVLDSTKLAGAGIKVRPVKEALEYSLANWKEEIFI